MQSFGFALFLRRVPGVVADPGLGFAARTMLVLTAGALGVMWLGERFLERTGDSAGRDEPALLGEAAPDLVAATGAPSQEGVPRPL